MKRSHKLERIDIGRYTKKQYQNCLKHLGRIGKYLFGDQATFKELDKQGPFSSILDIGSGGGQLTIRMAKRYPNAKVLGVDVALDAIEYANQLKKPNNVSFRHMPSKDLPFQENQFDIVTTCLVLHHMKDEEILAFLQKVKKIAKKAVIINDLSRSWVSFGLFALISPIFFPSRLIFQDGLLSIRKGFTRKELSLFAKKAGIDENKVQIKSRRGFRWTLTIPTTNMSF